MIKLDVITIAFNNREELLKTLKSIEPIREYIGLLIIKDGSQDRLLTDNDNVFKTFDNVKYIHSKDKGPYDAMNQSLKYVNNDFIWFLNSGDKLISRENFLTAIDGLTTDYCMAIYNWLLDEKIVLKKIDVKTFIKRIKYTWGARHQSIFFNTKIQKKYKIFYDLKYKITADRKFMIEFLKACNFNGKNIFSKNVFLTNNDKTGISQTKVFLKEKENILITREYFNSYYQLLTLIRGITRIMKYFIDSSLTKKYDNK